MNAAILLLSLALAATTARGNLFASELFGRIAENLSNENFVCSPISIETCLSMAFMGARGSTALELVKGLKLNTTNKLEIGRKYQKLFATKKPNEIALKIASRVYMDKKYKISKTFNQLAELYFGASAERVDFSQAEPTARKINSWVAQSTNNKIEEIVNADNFDSLTAAVLVNAIYFKALWESEFSLESTQKKPFSISAGKKIKVDTMYHEDGYLYGSFDEWDAQVIELPYLGTDISMLIILPNKIDGLADLERKLKSVDLTKIQKRLRYIGVGVSLPKFKLEFDIALQPILEKMGMKKIFTDTADFRKMVKNKNPLWISEVQHKAIIEVGEQGTEAAAATTLQFVGRSMTPEKKLDFIVDHPFMFAITDKEFVYFSGHINNPQKG